MRAKINEKNISAWVTAVLCLTLAMLGLLYFGGVGTKWLTLLAGFGVIALLLLSDHRRLWNLPSLLLLGYAAWSWMTVFWAMSGKFHLREGSKILIAVFFFLLVAMHKKFDGAFARRVMGMIAGASEVYAFISMEAVSTGIFQRLLQLLPAIDDTTVRFDGPRVMGAFGNSNIEASVFAAGMFCSLALVCGAAEKRERILFTLTLSVCAFSFLLAVSLGAIACLLAASVIYLIFAGQERSAVLMRMLTAAIPAVPCAAAAFRFLGQEQGLFVLLMMAASAVASVALELTISLRLISTLSGRQKAVFAVLFGAVLCAGVYLVAAMRVTGSYTFGPPLNRSVQLDAGEHVVRFETNGEFYAHVYAQSALELVAGMTDEIYDDIAVEEITFTLPEDNETVNFLFYAAEGVTLQRVVIDGQMELPLRYRLLPGFAANRLQNLAGSSSPALRRIYRQDALKLAAGSPMIGNGVGSFETGVMAVQSVPYETKYVHNFYLQVLLEDGVIGFALFIGALVAMLLVLWKKRRQLAESEFSWLYPALCAEFVMNGAQMCWDVSMSMIVFLCMTYAVYGLIVGTCAEPFAKKAAAEGDGKGKKAQSKKLDSSLLARNIGIVLVAVVVLTLCGNLYATSKANASVGSTDEFMGNLSVAARLDLYECNDKKLSYVIASLTEGNGAYRAQADKYAAQLAKAQSNTIPRYLVDYYLQTEQYDKAIDEAILGATYSASNARTWNNCAALLDEALFKSMFTPLLTEERAPLMTKLTDYYDALQSYNAGALVPVELSEETQAFFDKIVALSSCMDNDKLFVITLFTP